MHIKYEKIKFIVLLYFFLLFSIRLFSLEVDVDEIKKGKKIKFVNYEGAHNYIDTERSIRSIGWRLSSFRKINELFRYHMKYSIIHVVDDTTNDKFDADIISIDRDANVDHIRNVRLIISGYLERRYGYTSKQADILSVFITYYNAIYRGNIEYFSQIYKALVMKHINEKNAGISTKYYEWPGRTKILIPLTEEVKKGKIKSLDTEELSDEKVIEELKKEKDKGIEERKEMVKIREKDLEEKKKDVEKEKKEIEDKKNKLDEEKKKLEEDKKKIEEKQKEIEKEKEEAKKIEDEKERKKKEEEIKKEEDKLTKEKEELAKKEEDTKKKDEEVKKKEEETAKKEKEVKKQEEKIKKEKEDVKKDEQDVKIRKDPEKYREELIKKEEALDKKEQELKEKEDKLRENRIDEKIYQDKFYYLKVKEYMVEGHYNNEMYIIDAESRKILVKSPLDRICGKKYFVFKEGVVVISFKSTHDSQHYLALLDLDTLEVKLEGEDNIFWRSFVEVNDGYIYAILKEGEDYYLGKFDMQLKRTAISDQKVDFSTFITFYKNYIYVNDDKKEILVLNKDNLKKVDKIQPK